MRSVEEACMRVPLGELHEQVSRGVEKLGYGGDDARIITEVLMYAQLRGNNQGIAKIATGGVPRASETKDFRLVKVNKCGALFSGGHSMVASLRAAEKSVELASIHGVGVAATNHNDTSSGSIGYFARKIAEAGYIGIVCVGNGDWAAVAPTGSSEAKLGTNPLAYAFPYDGGVVVFHTTTAAMSYYGVIEAMLKGEALPVGVGFDSAGDPTTDAAKILGHGAGEAVGGALATVAGHKGYGLSLLVQLLGSAFSLAGFAGAYSDDGQGTFVLALDPGLLADTSEYMKRSRELVESIKNARPLAGQTVLLPGERGDDIARTCVTSGEIEIADAL
jgi:LDH2 family malate/lactate/ureidoglycolate dehydrogenase